MGRVKGVIWCLHGAVGRAADWQGFSVPGWAVRRVNLWRFLSCTKMPMKEFGQAFNAEAEQAQLQGGAKFKQVLVAYSMGGRLALHALLAGGPWAAAVLVSTHPGLQSEAERRERRQHDAEWAAIALRAEWGEFIEKWNAQGILQENPGKHESVLQMVNRRELQFWRAEVARSFIDWSLGAQEYLVGQIPRISCPQLWISGERDEKFTGLLPSESEKIKRWIAPDSGHRVPWENEKFTSQVREFLEHSVS